MLVSDVNKNICVEKLKLNQYMYYYNNERRHEGINYLIPNQKLLKLTIEDSLKENSKGQNHQLVAQPVGEKLKIKSNLFLTELVGGRIN